MRPQILTTKKTSKVADDSTHVFVTGIMYGIYVHRRLVKNFKYAIFVARTVNYKLGTNQVCCHKMKYLCNNHIIIHMTVYYIRLSKLVLN